MLYIKKLVYKRKYMKKQPTAYVLSIIALQVLMWIQIVAFVIMFALYLLAIDSGLPFGIFEWLVLLNLASIILYHYVIKGLKNVRKWSRITAIVLGVLMLFGFPLGTIIGILLIYGMTKGWPYELFKETNKIEETNTNPQAV